MRLIRRIHGIGQGLPNEKDVLVVDIDGQVQIRCDILVKKLCV